MASNHELFFPPGQAGSSKRSCLLDSTERGSTVEWSARGGVGLGFWLLSCGAT